MLIKLFTCGEGRKVGEMAKELKRENGVTA